jgi:hypothetical protein
VDRDECPPGVIEPEAELFLQKTVKGTACTFRRRERGTQSYFIPFTGRLPSIPLVRAEKHWLRQAGIRQKGCTARLCKNQLDAGGMVVRRYVGGRKCLSQEGEGIADRCPHNILFHESRRNNDADGEGGHRTALTIGYHQAELGENNYDAKMYSGR